MGSASNGEGSGSTTTRRPVAVSTIPRVTNAVITQATRTTRNYDLQNGGSCPRRPRSLTPSSTTQPEMGDAQSQADHGHPPTLAVKSALLAEYQKWPFQSFLKRTRIGSKTTYCLEFQLSHIPEHLYLPVLFEALGMRSNKETSADAITPHDASAHFKMHSAAVRPRIKRIRWTLEEDATILKMREVDGCSWEEIHAALPHRTPGAIQVQYSTKLKK
ncbi:uncharacterized protein PAC_20209 [Phialocephala subalpina]|uniref:Myb-like domain-containing protein n=1 Tax=Phialocephala subalpina TaxID=576137 RepID=A0A1L7XVV0_9HELO|nr:uncharacterized protein PAC_20209 [Phialocephala subalpina]